MSDAVRIILLIVVLALVIGGGVAVYYQFFYKKEGSDCKPTVPVEHASAYEYDADQDCKTTACESGYAIVGNSCESTTPEADPAADPEEAAAAAAAAAADSPLNSATTASTAAACSQFFTISDECHETDKAGIKWTWNTDAGENGSEGATCRDQVDHYDVEAISSWDPTLTLFTRVPNKNTLQTGLSGFDNFFNGQTIKFKVIPKNSKDENLITPGAREREVPPTAISCSTKGISPTSMAPDWNNGNMLAADVYLEEAPLSYESLTTRNAAGLIASDYGSGSKNITGKKTHRVQVPLGGSITSDCDGDGKDTFTLSWDTISKDPGFDMGKTLRVVGDCDYASGDGGQFKSIKFY